MSTRCRGDDEGGELRFESCEVFGGGDGGEGPSEGVSSLQGSGDLNTLDWRLYGEHGLNNAQDTRTSGVVVLSC